MADPSGGAPGTPPLRTKIFLISCSFWENPANLYVGAPLGVGAPEQCLKIRELESRPTRPRRCANKLYIYLSVHDFI